MEVTTFLGCSWAPRPGSWLSMLMEDCQHDDSSLVDEKIHGVRERANQAASHPLAKDRKSKWVFLNLREQSVDIIEKSFA